MLFVIKNAAPLARWAPAKRGIAGAKRLHPGIANGELRAGDSAGENAAMDDKPNREGRQELPPREEMPSLYPNAGAMNPREAQAAQQQQ